MISKRNESPVAYGQNANGALIAMGWNFQTWYYDYDQFTEVPAGSHRCLLLTLDKRVLESGEYKRDIELRWRDPARRFVEVDADQRLLEAHGEWIAAKDIIPGKTMLQSMCGNGHVTLIEAVEDVGARECSQVIVPRLGSYVVAGVILEAPREARDGRGGGGGDRGAGGDRVAGGARGGSRAPDESPQRVGHSTLA